MTLYTVPGGTLNLFMIFIIINNMNRMKWEFTFPEKK